MEYQGKPAGFWKRTFATLLDSLLIMVLTWPPLVYIYGSEYFFSDSNVLIAGPADFLISWVLPSLGVILFWLVKQATPGKLLVAVRIVDSSTGDRPTGAQLVGRYLAYFVSIIPLGLGFFWVAFDKRKQGWHDKLAGTLVVLTRMDG